MAKFSGMCLILNSLAGTARQSAAFGVGPLRTISRPLMTRLAASDNDFDNFSAKVRSN
jgi:hypothetical protein